MAAADTLVNRIDQKGVIVDFAFLTYQGHL